MIPVFVLLIPGISNVIEPNNKFYIAYFSLMFIYFFYSIPEIVDSIVKGFIPSILFIFKGLNSFFFNLRYLHIASVFFLLLGIGDMNSVPDMKWYYSFLRVFIFMVSIATIFFNYKEMKNSELNLWNIIFSLVFVFIYNPVIPVYLYDKNVWIAINLFTALFYLKHLFSFNYDQN